MLKLSDAERIVADELEKRGHRVLRVDVLESIHNNQRDWPAIAVICLGEVKRYDCCDYSTLQDESTLRSFLTAHWIPSARRSERINPE